MALPSIGFDFLVTEGTISNPSQKYPTGALLRANSSTQYTWTQCSPNAADGNGNTCGTTTPGTQYTDVSTTGTGTTDPVVTLTAGTCPTGYLSTYGSGAHTVYVRYAWGTANGYAPPGGETSVSFSGALCVSGTAPANPPPNGVTYAIYDGTASYQEYLHPFDGVTLIAGSGGTLGSLTNYLSGVPQGGALPLASAAFLLTGPNPAGQTQWFNVNMTDCMTALGTPLIGPTLSLGQVYSTTIENWGLESGRVLNQEETQGCAGGNIAAGEHSGYFHISACDAEAMGFLFQGSGAQNSGLADIKSCGFNRPGRVGIRFENCISCRGIKNATASGPFLGTQWFDRAGVEVLQDWWVTGRPQAISATDYYAEAANAILLCENSPCIGSSLNTSSPVGRRAIYAFEGDWADYDVFITGDIPLSGGVCGIHDNVWDADIPCSSGNSSGSVIDSNVSVYQTGNLGGNATTAPYAGTSMYRMSSDPYIAWVLPNTLTVANIFDTGLTPVSVASGANINWTVSGSWASGYTTLTSGVPATLNVSGLVPGYYYFYVFQPATGTPETLAEGTGCTWELQGSNSGSFPITVSLGAKDAIAFFYDGTRCNVSMNTNFKP